MANYVIRVEAPKRYQDDVVRWVHNLNTRILYDWMSRAAELGAKPNRILTIRATMFDRCHDTNLVVPEMAEVKIENGEWEDFDSIPYKGSRDHWLQDVDHITYELLTAPLEQSPPRKYKEEKVHITAIYGGAVYDLGPV